LIYHGESRLVRSHANPLTPAMTRENLVRLLEKAGFRTIVFDPGSTVRTARIMAGDKGRLITHLSRIPAWYESRFSKGAVLSCFAWK
jgi:hypothetical protein